MVINAITLSQMYVLDQGEALDFYVGKLGMEVKNDIDFGFMRWLTWACPAARPGSGSPPDRPRRGSS